MLGLAEELGGFAHAVQGAVHAGAHATREILRLGPVVGRRSFEPRQRLPQDANRCKQQGQNHQARLGTHQAQSLLQVSPDDVCERKQT